MDGFSWLKEGNVHIDAKHMMKRSYEINNQSYICRVYMLKCDWSPMSKYVVVVTAICHISVNSTAFLNWQREVEIWYIVATFLYLYYKCINRTYSKSARLFFKTPELGCVCVQWGEYGREINI